jgi:hypothetical protein
LSVEDSIEVGEYFKSELSKNTANRRTAAKAAPMITEKDALSFLMHELLHVFEGSMQLRPGVLTKRYR